MFSSIFKNGKRIAIYTFAIGSMLLFTLNWNEYSLYQTFVKYNDCIYALIITITLLLYFADSLLEIIKSDKVLWLVIGINVLAFLLLLIGGRGVRTFVLLYDLTISLYIAYKSHISLRSNRIIGIMCVIIAGFFIYWTIDVKGYFKGYSINYGGLVLLSGFVFLIIVVEYLKSLYLQIKSDNSIIRFIQSHRYYLIFLEIGLFIISWKIMSYYRSRTAFFSMICFAILLVLPWEIIRKKVVYYSITIASIAGGFLIPALYLFLGRSITNPQDYELFYKPVFSDRISIWPQLFDLFKSFPITGIGTLYMKDASPYRDGMLDTCNSFINLYVYYGAIVATLVIVLLVIVVLKMYDNVNKNPLSKVAYAGVISFIVAAYFESFFTTVPFMAVFIMAIIMIRTLSEEKCEYATEIEYYKGLFKTDFKEKFVAVFIPSFALIFMYFIFGPIEIYYANIDEYVFNISSFATILIPISISVVIALSLVIASMPKVVSIVMSVIASGISLASYVQYMFFNEDLVDEFGIFAEAKTLGAKYYISIIVFFVILMTVITVGVLLKNKKYILFVPAIVTVIQMVALISILIPIIMMPNKGNYIRILDTESEFEVAKEENIIVLMLDTFGRNYFEEVKGNWPERIEPFHDFTYYENADSKYAPTFPSLVHMLTDTEYDDSMKRREYEKNAFTSENSNALFDLLHSQGYECSLYTTDMIMDSYLDEIFDNVKVVRKRDNHKAIISVLLKQSAYRYVPYCVKPIFQWTLDEAKSTYAYENAKQYYLNYEAYNYLTEQGLRINESVNKKFMYLHLEGAHSYPHNDEECNQVEMSSVSQAACGAGSLKMVGEYLEQLKKLGKYDSSTIIILADHGDGDFALAPIFMIKKKGEGHETMRINKEPFEYCEFNYLIKSIVNNN